MTESNKVLVVEDNDFVRMQIVRFLNEAGYETDESADGGSALEKVGKHIAIVIADVRMEPVDGFEFVRSLRGRNIQTPVILVTGDHNPDLLSEASKWGISAVLMKPVQRDRLVKTVEKMLSHRRAES